MAQAFSVAPPAQSPVANPLTFEFYENTEWRNANTTEFYFAIEVFVEGTSVGTYKTAVEYSSGANGYGKFDVSPIIESYVSANKYNTDFVSAAPIISYYITFTPEYIKSGTVTTGSTTASTTIRNTYAWQGCFLKKDWLDFQDGNLFPNVKDNDTVSLVEWLTQYPSGSNYLVASDEDAFIFTCAYGTTFSQVNVELFDASDVSITSDTYTFAANIDDGLLINCSQANIIANTTITQANFDAAAYYKIKALDDTATPVVVTETFTFYIDVECTNYKKVRAYFLGKTGNIESFTFKLASRERVRTKPTNYRQRWGTWSETSDTFERTLQQGGSTTYFVESSATIEINTDWLKEEVQNWLARNMYESPLILLEDSDGIRAASINQTGYQIRQRVNDGATMETITLNISHNEKSQRL